MILLNAVVQQITFHGGLGYFYPIKNETNKQTKLKAVKYIIFFGDKTVQTFTILRLNFLQPY